MRKFEKISYPEFVKVFGDNKTLYDDYMLPLRGTKFSAGYDFFAIKDYVIKPNEIVKIPTGYKATFESDEMLMIVVRSSIGFKYNVRLTNQVGLSKVIIIIIQIMKVICGYAYKIMVIKNI